jgi:hypothetical protein
VKQRGHPIRGAIAGLLFGIFVSLDLVIFGVLALDANLLALIPVLGLVAGVLLGVTTPLRRRSADEKQSARTPSMGTPKPDPKIA